LPFPPLFGAATGVGAGGVVVVAVGVGVGVVVVVVVVVVGATSPVSEAVSSVTGCPVPAPPAAALATAPDEMLDTGPMRAPPPARLDAAPPGVPLPVAGRPAPDGDPKFGTFAGVVGCALVSGTLTGPLPMTSAATMDIAAATALRDAIAPSRQSWGRRGLAAPTAAAPHVPAPAAGTTAADGGVGRPKSGDAKTSSRVA
jgi:hypothetical protein